MEQAFIAYPAYPKITEEILQRIENLGGTDHIPIFGTWVGEALKNLFGWKFARKANVYYHNLKKNLSSGSKF
jgi:hypothetical protein